MERILCARYTSSQGNYLRSAYDPSNARVIAHVSRIYMRKTPHPNGHGALCVRHARRKLLGSSLGLDLGLSGGLLDRSLLGLLGGLSGSLLLVLSGTRR